ncbi:MAG: hypothetical protein IKM33_04890 [Clostridia bacterium]|nr:hypothetical protein [Clostridia bacterium]
MPFLNTNIPELSGFDTGLCLSNLDILMVRQNRVSESMLAVLAELCDAILRDAEGDPDTVDSILLSLQSLPEGETDGISPSASSVAPVNRESVTRISSLSGLYARLLLYAMIEKRMPSAPAPGGVSPLLHSARGRIAYMPAAFADKAYLALSAAIESPRAVATPSFVDACEEVRGGLCEFCILPLESSHSGKLTAFTRLLLRYNLRIKAVCDLENGAAEGQITRFALLRATHEGYFPAPLRPPKSGEPLYLELIHTGESPSLTVLLAAAEFCGIRLCRVDTLPRLDEPDSDSSLLSCVLDAADGDLPTFRRFLSLEASEDTVIGLYGSV